MSTTQDFGGIFKLKNLSAGGASADGVKLWNLVFDMPGEKVNKLNESVIGAIQDVLKTLKEKNSEIDALMVTSPKPGIFVAGADIKMIQTCVSPLQAENLAWKGDQIFSEWEDLPFPTIAVINGAALGGGCEMS
jgi:3-hydroxyacyl-CoA dehydrogenase/enoyl-CoA hydratase/3-hydroxybutyryl-CoA epimerase